MYLNPFLLETKFENTDIIAIRNLWKVCLPLEIFNYISLDENFKKLNELNLKIGTCYNITCGFLKEDSNFELIKNHFQKYYIIYEISFSKYFKIII